MDEKISELKESQVKIGNKINMIQKTNKKNDEETEKIRELIAQCRENLKRMKYNATGSLKISKKSSCNSKPFQNERNMMLPCGAQIADICGKYQEDDPCAGIIDSLINDSEAYPCQSATMKIATKISTLADAKEKSKICLKKIREKIEREIKVKVNSLKEDTCDKAGFSDKSYDFCDCDSNGNIPHEDMKEVPVIYLTHPGNMVLLVGIIMVVYLISANLCNSKRSPRVKFFLNMLYLSTFAFHYGTVLWMGIIRGLALQSGLSREAFIIVDNLILPKYFAICVFLSALTLYSFLATHCISFCTSWPLSVFLQVLVKCITFFVELVTICYIVPAIIKLRHVLDEVGSDDDGLFSEGYCTNMGKLAKLNWIISSINALTILFMGSTVYYITSKLNIG